MGCGEFLFRPPGRAYFSLLVQRKVAKRKHTPALRGAARPQPRWGFDLRFSPGRGRAEGLLPRGARSDSCRIDPSRARSAGATQGGPKATTKSKATATAKTTAASAVDWAFAVDLALGAPWRRRASQRAQGWADTMSAQRRGARAPSGAVPRSPREAQGTARSAAL